MSDLDALFFFIWSGGDLFKNGVFVSCKVEWKTFSLPRFGSFGVPNKALGAQLYFQHSILVAEPSRHREKPSILVVASHVS